MPSTGGQNTETASGPWDRTRRVVTIVVVLAMSTSMWVGVVAADDGGQAVEDVAGDSLAQQSTADNYTVQQGDDCFEIRAFTGNESVKSFYDYQTPIEDNPYTNQTGMSYSSEGTTDLQRPNTSVFFLYEDDAGNLSLVFVHGEMTNESDGGSATFDITGLPENGTWAVRDDDYENQNDTNYDTWAVDNGTTTVNWTWDQAKTDGGAYAGMGEEFNVTVAPSFNEDAELYQEYYNGTVTNWTAVSNATENQSYTELNLSQNVSVTTDECEPAGAEPTEADEGDDGEDTQQPDGDETDGQADDGATVDEDDAGAEVRETPDGDDAQDGDTIDTNAISLTARCTDQADGTAEYEITNENDQAVEVTYDVFGDDQGDSVTVDANSQTTVSVETDAVGDPIVRLFVGGDQIDVVTNDPTACEDAGTPAPDESEDADGENESDGADDDAAGDENVTAGDGDDATEDTPADGDNGENETGPEADNETEGSPDDDAAPDEENGAENETENEGEDEVENEQENDVENEQENGIENDGEDESEVADENESEDEDDEEAEEAEGEETEAQ